MSAAQRTTRQDTNFPYQRERREIKQPREEQGDYVKKYNVTKKTDRIDKKEIRQLKEKRG